MAFSVAALIKHAGGGGAGAMIETFEQMLFPAFNLVLQQDVQEFHPYVFQVWIDAAAGDNAVLLEGLARRTG